MLIRANKIPSSLHASSKALRECIEAFAGVLPVERVILFGSRARGDAEKWSDVDLCVVARGIKSQQRAAHELRKAVGHLRNKPPMTLIPISPERLAEKRRNHDPFFETVMKEGVCIAEED